MLNEIEMKKRKENKLNWIGLSCHKYIINMKRHLGKGKEKKKKKRRKGKSKRKNRGKGKWFYLTLVV